MQVKPLAMALVSIVLGSIPRKRFDSIQTSRDGRYLYALYSEEAKLAVIDIAKGRATKVLDRIGNYPRLILALP